MILLGICATCDEAGRPARVVLTRHGECSVCGSRAVMRTPALHSRGRILDVKVSSLRDLTGALQLGEVSQGLLDQLDLTLKSIQEDMEGITSRVSLA